MPSSDWPHYGFSPPIVCNRYRHIGWKLLLQKSSLLSKFFFTGDPLCIFGFSLSPPRFHPFNRPNQSLLFVVYTIICTIIISTPAISGCIFAYWYWWSVLWCLVAVQCPQICSGLLVVGTIRFGETWKYWCLRGGKTTYYFGIGYARYYYSSSEKNRFGRMERENYCNKGRRTFRRGSSW